MLSPMLVAVLLLLPCIVTAQRAGRPASTASAAARPEPPHGKGVWESVSYSADITFTDVFFVTGDVGWVAGKAGTILHTADGGATWDVQLGGDPQASEPEITA